MFTSELLRFLGGHYDPPSWIVEDVLESGPASVRAELTAAIEALTPDDLQSVSHDARAQADVVFRTRDTDVQVRLYIVSREAARSLERARLAAATQSGPSRTLEPYGHPALSGITVDAEGLVPLSAFEIVGDALCINDHAFFVLPPVPGANAPYWTLQRLGRPELVDSVRVRLDPLLHGPRDKLSGRFYRMDVYGRPLDWERIQQLRNTEHGSWIPGRLSRGYLATEYAWVPHSHEVDFICEELPRHEEVEVRGARYLHAVYDKRTRTLTHLDGAIRVYSPGQLATRAASHVRNAGKAGKRVKVFRTDRPIVPDLLGELAQAFFVWNYDVARYFGAPVHPGL
ncbi:MAG: hypothetical protein JO180_10770 [Gemmatirosa sp.]|nr:hypothetical protein [Gemmatirosa sp.]